MLREPRLLFRGVSALGVQGSSGFRVWGLGRSLPFRRVSDLGFGGLGFRSLGRRVWGLFRV